MSSRLSAVLLSTLYCMIDLSRPIRRSVLRFIVYCLPKCWVYTRHENTGPRQLTASKLNADYADWLKRAILNIFLLYSEPSCPNPHFVTKSLRRNQWRNHCNEIVASRSVDLACENTGSCLAFRWEKITKTGFAIFQEGLSVNSIGKRRHLHCFNAIGRHLWMNT